MLVVGGTAVAAHGAAAGEPPGRHRAARPLGRARPRGGRRHGLARGDGRPAATRARSATTSRGCSAPAFDDSYTLVLAPRLPGVPADLAALLVGPAGVRALIARRWRGRYRVRGRGWELDTRSRAGWIPTLTNPSFDADAVADAVTRWSRTAHRRPERRHHARRSPSRGPTRSVVLEEPVGEIVTTDNAPWWAQSIGRVQRLDAHRAARFIEAVLSASEAEATAAARSAAPRVA